MPSSTTGDSSCLVPKNLHDNYHHPARPLLPSLVHSPMTILVRSWNRPMPFRISHSCRKILGTRGTPISKAEMELAKPGLESLEFWSDHHSSKAGRRPPKKPARRMNDRSTLLDIVCLLVVFCYHEHLGWKTPTMRSRTTSVVDVQPQYRIL